VSDNIASVAVVSIASDNVVSDNSNPGGYCEQRSQFSIILMVSIPMIAAIVQVTVQIVSE
jgi:hypothetical protein